MSTPCKECGAPTHAPRESHIEALKPELGAHTQIYLSVALAQVMQAFGALSPIERSDVRGLLAALLSAGQTNKDDETLNRYIGRCQTDPIHDALRAISIVVSCLDP